MTNLGNNRGSVAVEMRKRVQSPALTKTPRSRPPTARTSTQCPAQCDLNLIIKKLLLNPVHNTAAKLPAHYFAKRNAEVTRTSSAHTQRSGSPLRNVPVNTVRNSAQVRPTHLETFERTGPSRQRSANSLDITRRRKNTDSPTRLRSSSSSSSSSPLQRRKAKEVTPNPVTDALRENEIVYLIVQSREVFMSEPMLLELSAPINICGDVHGQYHDLLRLFELGKYPPESNYLFLGDYVDRGTQSLEAVCLLLAYKLRFPSSFYLLRGNHEVSSINRIYGFFDECKRRFSVKLWKLFTDTFTCMPVAALVNGRILCMHGGLSPELHSFNQIRCILRPTDVPDTGLICDLLWADPSEAGELGWGPNERGVSWTFGEDVVADTLKLFDLDIVCRAHQVMDDGYAFFANRGLLTVFSAPNYCGEFDNTGAFLVVNEEMVCSIIQLPPTSNAKVLM